MEPALIVIFVALAIAYAASIFLLQSPRVPQRVRYALHHGALVLDVRNPEDFAAGHYPGAKNIPLDELAARLDELPDRRRPIVLYCTSGMRSSRAARLLQQAGYTHVVDAETVDHLPPPHVQPRLA